MKKVKISILAGVACAVLLAIPSAAADKSMPAKAGTTNATAVRTMWPAETMTAKITIVDPSAHLVVLEGQNRVPFDIIVTTKTRIMSGDRELKFGDLTRGKKVTIQFVPERRGDVAESIHVGG